MGLSKLAVSLVAAGLMVGGSTQDPTGDRMDRTGAFYRPTFADTPDLVLAETSIGNLDVATYLRYLAGIHGKDALDDLAFDVLLAHECDVRRIGRAAPLLARSQATQRLNDSGRDTDPDTSPELRRRYVNEALRAFRADALVRADRQTPDGTVRALFERRFGVGGRLVSVRHVLVTPAAAAARLARERRPFDPESAKAAARERAAEIRARFEDGAPITELLALSDDKRTRDALADPARAGRAGLLDEVADARYGQAFFDAARGLEPGAVAGPIETRLGFHVVWLEGVRETDYDEVAERLRTELRAGPATREEVDALRRSLFDRYGYRPIR